jgi:hypothetical protein
MLRRAEVVGWKQSRKPPMRLRGVSVAIVLGGRESRPQGEGPQLERWVRSNPAECEGLGILAEVSRALRPSKSSQAVAGCGESVRHAAHRVNRHPRWPKFRADDFEATT